MRIPLIPQQYATAEREMRASHIKGVLQPKTLIAKANWCAAQVRLLKADTLVCRGSSGLLVTSVVSTLARLPICYIRKPRESSHTGLLLEGPYELGRFIVIDDLVSSGETMRAIADAIHSHTERYGFKAELVAILLYFGTETIYWPNSRIATNAGF